MNLDDITAYLQVVASGSLSQAAKVLDRPKASVSHQIRRLENELGTPLFQRTSNNMALSEAGQGFYEHALTIRRACEQGRDSMLNSRQQMDGRIHIATSSEFTSNLATLILLGFAQRRPEVEVKLMLFSKDILADVRDQYDCILYLGDPPLPQFANMSARLLGRFRFGLFATETYLKNHGVPERPKELLQSRLIGSHNGTCLNSWHLISNNDEFILRPETKILSNDFGVVKLATLHHHGIGFMPTFFVEQEEKAGALKRVLPHWASPEIPIFALFWSHRFANPNLRALIDSLADNFDELHSRPHREAAPDRAHIM